MGRPTKVEYEGKLIDGDSLDFDIVKEHWNEYQLENGGVVRVRIVPAEMILTQERNPQGKPLVVVQSSILIQYREPGETGGS